jgi:uncharacterized membrane protein YqjE
MTSEHDDRVQETEAPRQATQGTGGLLHTAINEASHLVTGEIQLAKQEVSESLHAAVIALITGITAAFAGIAFLVMGIVALVIAVPAHWVAALACAGGFLVIAIVTAAVAVSRVKRISPLRQTVQTLKEDVEWAKQQLTLEQR